MKHVVLLLEEVLQLLHEELALQLIFLVVELVELPERQLASQAFLKGAVHTVHIDRELYDLPDFPAHVAQSLLDKLLHLQEVAGD